jgi:hypothetical protein
MKILKRPMFRKGGTTGGGIMNNVVERGQYAESNADDLSINTDKDIKGLSISDKINLVESLGGPDTGLGDPFTQFLLQIGPSIGTTTGKGGLIPNILEASKEPVSDLITAQRARKKTRQAIGLEFIKDLSDSDKIALQEKIEYLMSPEGGGFSKQEAFDRVVPEFRKDASKASIARGVKEDYIKSIAAANTDYEGNVLFDDRQARLIYDDEQKLKETNPEVYNSYFRGDPSTRYIYQYDNYDPETMTVKEGSDLELLPENRVVYDISTGNFIKRQGKKVIIIDTTVVED